VILNAKGLFCKIGFTLAVIYMGIPSNRTICVKIIARVETRMTIFKKRRRNRLMQKLMPEDWLAILRVNVPYYNCLPQEDQHRLQGLIHIFLDEKSFEGVGGLEMTDEIRLTIAAQACILMLHRHEDLYPELRTIIVYPHTYHVQETIRRPEGTEIESSQIRLGESWSYGTVVLSWDNVLHGASDIHDGENVVYHEFAHQLDNETGIANGAPDLPGRSRYLAWARVISQEYSSLVKHLRQNRPEVFRSYGALSPAEFFAVATELFFEKPIQLRSQHPALYEQLQLFYQQDPAMLIQCT
jgi:Mlc titration factor MtfA (ptsG expression regulator)